MCYVSFCVFRINVTEEISIEGCNLGFSVTTRQGKTIPILKDCSLRIPSGQFWMLLGPNGCGKSTLLKVCKSYCFLVEGLFSFGIWFSHGYIDWHSFNHEPKTKRQKRNEIKRTFYDLYAKA